MVNYLIAAAVIVTPVAVSQEADKTLPPPPMAQVQDKPAKQPTPEDYYVPWDNWLKKQGSPINGIDVWHASQETKIKGEVLICITGAETNFGKVAQRGSHTNVGSVGSYDATNTTHSASSVREGLTMIGKTLNNGLLGHKTTIAQLSRKSEPYGAIYASSTHNWETNVVGCLSKITGSAVTNQFQFRLGGGNS